MRCAIAPLMLLALFACALSAAPAQAVANPFVGITSDENYAAIGEGREHTLPDIAGAGVGTIRQTFDWSFLEYGQQPGELNFPWLDRFVGASAQNGIAVLPILFNPPQRLTRRPARGAKRGAYPPRDLGAIGSFGARLAQRYGPDGQFWRDNPSLPKLPIRAWQIWNEPNLPVYWQPRPDARAYGRMVKLASQRIKAVDPGAEIVTAGMPESDLKGAVPIERFLRGMLRGGAKGRFDTFGLNAYARTGKGVVGKVGKYRRVLNKLGARKAGIRVTEFGWADRGRSPYVAGRAKQGRYVADAVRGLWGRRAALRIRGFVYYGWRDQSVYPGGRDLWGLHTGLHFRNGLPKPALARFRDAARSLR